MKLRNESFILNDTIEIPKVGLGVYLSEEGKEAYNAVRWALECGHRHIDTAAIYGNEESVGKALKDSGLDRSEVFITTKLWNDMQRTKDVNTAFDESRRKLGVDYVDLYLIHWPNYKFDYNVQAYEVMLKLKSEGKIRSVGVSNFNVEHIDFIIEKTGVVPSINQVQRHPKHNQKALKEYCENLGIRLESWSPLMQGKFVGEKLFEDIAQKYDKTAAQIIVRWHIQGGAVVIPKSVRKDRIISNTDVFDFELTDDDMNIIDNFEQGTYSNPADFRFGFDGY